jgi:toxin YoeB
LEIIYSPEALQDIRFWKKSGEKKIIQKINALINSIEQNPFSGIGKPEMLKYDLAGCWSRRINIEHRLVYRIIDKETIEIVSLRFHYE